MVTSDPYSIANFTLIAHVNVPFNLPFLSYTPGEGFCQGGAPATTMSVIILSLPMPPTTFGDIFVNGTLLTNADLPFETDNPNTIIDYLYGPVVNGPYRSGTFNYICSDGMAFSTLEMLPLIVITPEFVTVPFDVLTPVAVALPTPSMDNPVFILTEIPFPNETSVFLSQYFNGVCNASDLILPENLPTQLLNLDGIFCFFFDTPLPLVDSGVGIIAQFTITYQLNSDLEPLQLIILVSNYLFVSNQTDATAYLNIPLQLEFFATDTRSPPPPGETFNVIVLTFPDPTIGELEFEISPGVFVPVSPSDLGVPFPVDPFFLSPFFLSTTQVNPSSVSFLFQMQINQTGWLSGVAQMTVLIGATAQQPNITFPVSSFCVNQGVSSPLNVTLVVPDFAFFPPKRPLHVHIQSLTPAFFQVFINPVVITNFQLQMDLDGTFDPNIQSFGSVSGTNFIFELQGPYDLLQLAMMPLFITGEDDGASLNTGQTNEFPPSNGLLEVGACLVPPDSQDPNDPNQCSANPLSGHMHTLPICVNAPTSGSSSALDALLAIVSFFWLIVGLCALLFFLGCVCMAYQAGKLAKGIDDDCEIWCKPWCIRNCGCYKCKQYEKPKKKNKEPLITGGNANVLHRDGGGYDMRMIRRNLRNNGLGIGHDDL